MVEISSVDDSQKKSGIKVFKPGEVLFKQNDVATSLFIIQKGQVRLYIPKGRGFVDLAILRSGEVIGEMAYFDEKSRRRSCSAAAIVSTEVIEISFKAFGKTLEGLNPWFKTIINTLAERLRKTNDKVKALESNSVGFGQGGKVSNYKFFHNIDIIRILTILYITFKIHGEKNEDDNKFHVHMNKLKFYMNDIFNVLEVKCEEFYRILYDENFMELGNDKDGLPKILKVPDIERFRGIMVFFNTQRAADDEKKLKVSPKCEIFLKAIVNQLIKKGEQKEKAAADISSILVSFEEQKLPISDEDLRDAITAKLCDDVLVGEGNKLTSVVNFAKLKKLLPSIQLMNAIDKINEAKEKQEANN